VSGYRSFAYRTDIGVPVERVWRAFTDSRVLERWTVAGASVTPREKGRVHIVFHADVELDAQFERVVGAPSPRAGDHGAPLGCGGGGRLPLPSHASLERR